MGIYSPTEDQRITPFIKEAIITKQTQIMEAQKKKYIQSLLELKKSKKSQDIQQQIEAIIDGNGQIFGLNYGVNCTSLMRK